MATPVWSVDKIPAGCSAHVGDGVWLMRCDRGCGQVYRQDTLADVQRHIWEVHGESVPIMAPPTTKEG